MPQPKIPSPVNVSPTADKYTKQAPDYTGTNANERVLHINCWFFKYGTNDKVHAAALVLAVLLLVIIVFVIFSASDANSSWMEKAFNWLSTTFTFVTGIALGGKALGGEKAKSPEED